MVVVPCHFSGRAAGYCPNKYRYVVGRRSGGRRQQPPMDRRRLCRIDTSCLAVRFDDVIVT